MRKCFLVLIVILYSTQIVGQDSISSNCKMNSCLAYKVNTYKYKGYVIDVSKENRYNNFHIIYPDTINNNKSNFFTVSKKEIAFFESNLRRQNRKSSVNKYIQSNYSEYMVYPQRKYKLKNYIRRYIGYYYNNKKYIYVTLELICDINDFSEEDLEYIFTYNIGYPITNMYFMYLHAIYDIENDEIIEYTLLEE